MDDRIVADADESDVLGEEIELVSLRANRPVAVSTLRRREDDGAVARGARVLFVHGAGGRFFQFRHVARALLERGAARTCIGFDWPSHGRSPPLTAWGAHAAPELTADVAEFLDRYANNSANEELWLVAHSYGCTLTLRALQLLKQKQKTFSFVSNFIVNVFISIIACRFRFFET